MPYVQSGTDHFWTRGPIDGNAGFFGISGRTFAEAFHNGGQTKGAPTAIGLIGTNSQHSNLGMWPSDRNNFAPAIGFAWSPGFGGKDKTTIRGGYQIAYLLPGNSLSWVDLDNRTLPGHEYAATDSGGSAYRDLTSINFPLASPSSIPDKCRTRSHGPYDGAEFLRTELRITLCTNLHAGRDPVVAGKHDIRCEISRHSRSEAPFIDQLQ